MRYNVYFSLSASRVGGNLTPAWATWTEKVPHLVTSTEFLVLHNTCDITYIWLQIPTFMTNDQQDRKNTNYNQSPG